MGKYLKKIILINLVAIFMLMLQTVCYAAIIEGENSYVSWTWDEDTETLTVMRNTESGSISIDASNFAWMDIKDKVKILKIDKGWIYWKNGIMSLFSNLEEFYSEVSPFWANGGHPTTLKRIRATNIQGSSNFNNLEYMELDEIGQNGDSLSLIAPKAKVLIHRSTKNEWVDVDVSELIIETGMFGFTKSYVAKVNIGTLILGKPNSQKLTTYSLGSSVTLNVGKTILNGPIETQGVIRGLTDIYVPNNDIYEITGTYSYISKDNTTYHVIDTNERFIKHCLDNDLTYDIMLSKPVMNEQTLVYLKDSGEPTFNIELPVDLGITVKTVTVGTNVIPAEYLEITNSSITIKAEYLNKFSPNTYKVGVLFSDGTYLNNSAISIFGTGNSGSDSDVPPVVEIPINFEFYKDYPDNVCVPVRFNSANDIVSVKIGNVEVSESNWFIQDSALFIDKDYLSTLNAGKYRIIIKFNDLNNTIVSNVFLYLYENAADRAAPYLLQSRIVFDKSPIVLKFAPGAGDLAATNVLALIVDDDVILPTGEILPFSKGNVRKVQSAYKEALEIDEPYVLEEKETDVIIATSSNATKKEEEEDNTKIEVATSSNATRGEEDSDEVIKDDDVIEDGSLIASPSEASFKVMSTSTRSQRNNKLLLSASKSKIKENEEEEVQLSELAMVMAELEYGTNNVFTVNGNEITLDPDYIESLNLSAGDHLIGAIFDNTERTTDVKKVILTIPSSTDSGDNPPVVDPDEGNDNPPVIDPDNGDTTPDNKPDNDTPVNPDNGNDGDNSGGNVPDDKPDNGNTPDNKPDNGDVPDNKPDEGVTPDNKPDNGNTPDNGHKPDNGNTPDNNKPVNPPVDNGNNSSSGGSGGSGSSSSGSGGGSSSKPSGGSNTTDKTDNSSILKPDGSINPDYTTDVPNSGGHWEGSENDWTYVLPDGSTPKGEWVGDGENWFYINKDGKLEYDWFCDPETNKWYMLNREHNGKFGAALKGWYFEVQDGKYYFLNPSDFSMFTGWVFIRSEWYFFSATPEGMTYFGNNDIGWKFDINTTLRPYGSMYVNETTPDGYKVDNTGKYIK